MYRILIETAQGTHEYVVPAASKRQALKNSATLVLGMRVLRRTAQEIY